MSVSEKTAAVAQRRLIPVRRYCQFRQDLTQGTINGLVLKRNENGLASHVVRISGRLYLVEPEFEEWLLSHRESCHGKR